MPYLYILECVDGSYYTGSTWNLERRLWEHDQGLGARHTAQRLPVKLVYCEYFARVEDAFLREKQVQGWSRRKKLALIEGATEKLPMYSRNYTQYGPPASTGSADAGCSIRQPLPKPAVPEPAVPEPAVPEPAVPKPAVPEPAVPEPAVPEPAVPEPAVPEPVEGTMRIEVRVPPRG